MEGGNAAEQKAEGGDGDGGGGDGEGSNGFTDIMPEADRLVIFKSTTTMHQVLPLRSGAPSRFALSVWFRTAMKGSSDVEVARPITNICRFLPDTAPSTGPDDVV